MSKNDLPTLSSRRREAADGKRVFVAMCPGAGWGSHHESVESQAALLWRLKPAPVPHR